MTTNNTTNENTQTPSSPSAAARLHSSNSNLPPASPASASAQPIHLSGGGGGGGPNTGPYSMERTDTLYTVNQHSSDVNITVQTDSRVLRQRSTSQEMAVPSPSVLSSDAVEEKQPPSTTKKVSKGKSKSGMIKEPILNNSATCINPPSEVNARLDTQVEVRVYPCNNSNNDRKKKFTQFMVKPEVS